MQLIKSYLQLKDKSHLPYLQLENKVQVYLSEASLYSHSLIVSLHLPSVINNHFWIWWIVKQMYKI